MTFYINQNTTWYYEHALYRKEGVNNPHSVKKWDLNNIFTLSEVFGPQPYISPGPRTLDFNYHQSSSPVDYSR